MTDNETRVMSRALTRGATMLDDACDGCGNPLFRYQGEVFCPVCQETVAQKTEEDTQTTQDETSVEETDEYETNATSKTVDGDVDEHLRTLARRLARDAAERADDPEAVQRRLDALERTLNLLR
jgi:uncharacterized Zn finger protein (UPF0148 family)